MFVVPYRQTNNCQLLQFPKHRVGPEWGDFGSHKLKFHPLSMAIPQAFVQRCRSPLSGDNSIADFPNSKVSLLRLATE